MTDTDLMLAEIPALHAAAATDGQKSTSRRSIAGALVALVHIIFLAVFLIKAPPPEEELVIAPVVTYLDLGPREQDSNTLPLPDEEIPRGDANAINIAPLLIPPPRLPTQDEIDQELLGGLGRALACTAGQYEYLAPSLRANCDIALIPWMLDRQAAELRSLQPVDPNLLPLPTLSQIEAEQQRRGAIADPCAAARGNPMAMDACRTMRGAGVP